MYFYDDALKGFTCSCVVSVRGWEGGPLPLGALGGLRCFVVTLPEPSI